MNDALLCQYLDWDSEFFGCRIAKVTTNRLSQDDVEQVMAWCDFHKIECLYFFADIHDAATISLAESSGFSLVDIRVTLEKSFKRLPPLQREALPDCVIRLSRPEDIPFLQSIANVSHRNTRFHYDGHFSPSRCDTLYEIWIEKSCTESEDAVMVAELSGKPVGYACCHQMTPSTGRLSLTAVSEEARGKGLGERMTHAALEWLAQQEINQVIAVTQARNIASQRMHQKFGFLTQSVQIVYHRWFT